jgi:5-(carboxyamino)imidazole ribonucleotide synthase
VLRLEGAHAHYYGKDVKLNRKVGHVTVTASDEAELKTRVDAVLKLLNFREIIS